MRRGCNRDSEIEWNTQRDVHWRNGNIDFADMLNFLDFFKFLISLGLIDV